MLFIHVKTRQKGNSTFVTTIETLVCAQPLVVRLYWQRCHCVKFQQDQDLRPGPSTTNAQPFDSPGHVHVSNPPDLLHLT